jgi:hypothetical protein
MQDSQKEEKDMSEYFHNCNPDSDWGVIYSNAGKVNPSQRKDLFVVDNFYEDPMRVREIALNAAYFDDQGYLGMRTRKQYMFEGVKERFEKILGKKITNWESHAMNGRFQTCNAGIAPVYHCDDQMWAAMVYLTPNPPPWAGTKMFRHKATGITHKDDPRILECFNQHTFLDRTPYEMIDEVGNVFNRLVIFNGGLIHAPSEYFGWDLASSRLFHMYFFDTEKEDYDR